MICSQPIGDDEMAVTEDICYKNHVVHSSCLAEYLQYPTAEEKCCRLSSCKWSSMSFETMFGLRHASSTSYHNNPCQFVASQDEFTSSKTISRPLDTIISTFGEGKDYSELF